MSMRTLLRLTLFLVTAACSASGELRIDNVYARPTPPGVSVGAAFMTLQSTVADSLEAASTPVAEKVEIHSMSMADGMMQMRELQNLELPADQPVQLEPTGTHLMLLGLKQPLVANSQFLLKLHFKHAGERTVTVTVRASN
jgi:copper(I)-binding protein